VLSQVKKTFPSVPSITFAHVYNFMAFVYFVDCFVSFLECVLPINLFDVPYHVSYLLVRLCGEICFLPTVLVEAGYCGQLHLSLCPFVCLFPFYCLNRLTFDLDLLRVYW